MSAIHNLKNKIIIPLVKGEKAKIIKAFDLVESSRTKELSKGNYNPNAYKLLAKSGYDFENPTPMERLMKLNLMAYTKYKR